MGEGVGDPVRESAVGALKPKASRASPLPHLIFGTLKIPCGSGLARESYLSDNKHPDP
ncbi:hypothetical protein EMIT093MI4_60054 [Pseudomonas sp. IT-93MI4]